MRVEHFAIIALLFVLFYVFITGNNVAPTQQTVAMAPQQPTAPVQAVTQPAQVVPTIITVPEYTIPASPYGFYRPPYMWHGGWRRYGWADGPRPRRWWRR